MLLRGKLPADVVFVGEAPGRTENLDGTPFVGPAGQLLDDMIAAALRRTQTSPRIAFTNVIACIPWDDDAKGKVQKPDMEWVDACRPRLEEVLNDLCRPRIVFAVGSTAAEGLEQGFKHSPRIPEGCRIEEIIHPAAILRDNVANQQFRIQKTIVKLTTVLEKL